MSDGVTRTLVQDRVGTIAQPLYEGVSAGLADASARLAGYPHLDEYPALIPILARHSMRNYWIDGGITDQWQVLGQPHLMGQVILVHADDNLELRLLKERIKTYPGGAPVAGKNHDRRQYWTSPTLPIEVPGVSDTERTRLLLLWDRVILEDETRISVRVVHTLAPGYYGSAVPIDMSFNIEPSGQMFDQLAFEGDAQDEDLFPNIAEDDNEGDTFGT
jgi:hypothetical protein